MQIIKETDKYLSDTLWIAENEFTGSIIKCFSHGLILLVPILLKLGGFI